jgi:hypothetical protein
VGLCLASQQQQGQVSGFHQLAGRTLVGSFQNGRREIGHVLRIEVKCMLYSFLYCHEYIDRLNSLLKCIYVPKLLVFVCHTKVVIKVILKSG